ncbi:hypothetical protein CYLTODRAFT_486373 [Cylindrobasidium torrendii FP15055 ss-10]|uniref:Uncharacterized protein n=1 Tax=Cylindrobasidium torrendii FP15055 ss-10 TaxID=1314674 RepID=A0A0D7BPJ9_9AGAR|nr:hypothetical protein CYLTODRAFT_486373 [Cylindrobasidium torrendii FP15055 ss-10]
MDDARRVNTILHALRGESWRHQRNMDRVSHRPVPSQIDSLHRSLFPEAEILGPRKTWSGPSPPPSWRTKSASSEQDTSRRQRLLGLMYAHLPSLRATGGVPCLGLMCLRRIFDLDVPELDEILALVPPHLSLDLLHDTAIREPLLNSKLYALCGKEGHVDGELIVVGPTQSMRPSFFRRTEEALDNWEDVEDGYKQPLHTLIVAETFLSPAVMLSFPPTITHLGIVDVPSALPLHRLPALCPLLIVLDLSYNAWLDEGAHKIWERIVWTRWKSLEVLGLRKCYVDVELRKKVNAGRWDDVEIIVE